MFGLSGAFAICGTAVLIRNAVKTSSAKKQSLIMKVRKKTIRYLNSNQPNITF